MNENIKYYETTSLKFHTSRKTIHAYVERDGIKTKCGISIKGNGKWEIGYWQITCKECIAKEKELQPK